MVVPLTSISRCVGTKRAAGGCSLTFTLDVMHDLGLTWAYHVICLKSTENTGSSIHSCSSPSDPHMGLFSSMLHLCIDLPPLIYFLPSAIVLEMECDYSVALILTSTSTIEATQVEKETFSLIGVSLTKCQPSNS